MIADAGLERYLVLPASDSRCEHVWNQYTIRIPSRIAGSNHRDAIKAQLAAAGVGSEIYYPVPLHLQQCFKLLGYGPGSLPETEKAAREVLSLPIFPELTAAEQETVVARLSDAIARPQAKAA